MAKLSLRLDDAIRDLQDHLETADHGAQQDIRQSIEAVVEARHVLRDLESASSALANLAFIAGVK